MRRIRYAVAASLDGYIAGPKGESDWILIDPEIDFNSLFKEFDTIFVGRRSFQAAGAESRGGGSPMFGMKTFVFSRTLKPQDYPHVTIVGDDCKETVTALRKESGKDTWLFGGGLLFRSLLEAGLVDSVEVAVIPVLLGGGIPLLPAPAVQAKLELASHRVYKKTGTVGLEYMVKAKKGKKRN